MLKNGEGIEELLVTVTNRVLDAFENTVLEQIEMLSQKLTAAHEAQNPIAVAEAGTAILHLMRLVAMTDRGLRASCDMAYDTSFDRFEVLMQRIIDGSYDPEHTMVVTHMNIRNFTARLRDVQNEAPVFTGPGGEA